MESVATPQSENQSALRREIDRLKVDLDRLRTDFSGLAEDAVHAAKTGAGQAKETVEQKARAAAAKGRESVEAVESQVAAHPIMSLATALAVGMVIGLTLSRKD